jgi:hypothetical protein
MKLLTLLGVWDMDFSVASLGDNESCLSANKA